MKMLVNINGLNEQHNYEDLINQAIENGYTTESCIKSYFLEIYKSDSNNNKEFTFNEWLKNLD